MITKTQKNELKDAIQKLYDLKIHFNELKEYEHERAIVSRGVGLMEAMDILGLDYGIDEEGKAYVK